MVHGLGAITPFTLRWGNRGRDSVSDGRFVRHVVDNVSGFIRKRPKKHGEWKSCEYWRQDTQWCSKPEGLRCTHAGMPCNGRGADSQTGLFVDEKQPGEITW